MAQSPYEKFIQSMTDEEFEEFDPSDLLDYGDGSGTPDDDFNPDW